MPDKVDLVLEKLQTLFTKMEGIEAKHEALCARMDAVEAKGAGKKADAAPPESEGEWNDAVKIDSVATRNQAAAIQMRADTAFQALGLGQAPGHSYAEGLRNYRIRLLTPLKAHSKTFANAELDAVVDEAAFTSMEKQIIDDAVERSTKDFDHGAPLRMVTKMNDMGHRVTEFFGDPAVTWAPFMGGQAMFGKLANPNDFIRK